VARNRKRAKERRARQPQPFANSQNGGDDDEAQLDDSGAARSGEPGRRAGGTPEPLAHAAPDAELAEAQLALGRPELSSEHDEQEDAENLEEFEAEVDASRGAAPTGDGNGGGGRDAPRLESEAQHPAHTPNIFGRLINFLQGSWRELQRVQWPDRRQVMQATGVVIGFVIVAGLFLGVADFLAGHLMNYVLEGHW
jgi:preprotein translocase SecE subunit